VPAPPSNLAPPKPWKLAAIDFAVERFGVTSFADLGGIGRVYGQYAFHMLDLPAVKAGALVDDHPGLAHEWVAAEAERRGLRRIPGNFADPAVADEVGRVDAVLLFEVLLHAVAPDWDELCRMWAPRTNVFVIANPQWEGDASLRLTDLGREGYERVVPASENHSRLFDRLDEVVPRLGRPWRDAHFVWQWGITDADLCAVMASLGFSLEREETIGPFSGADGFRDRSFVFARG
jgi:hypothetical protein